MHAPSLMHAATAAVLRNGYLSHADSGPADHVRREPLVTPHARRHRTHARRAQRTADRRAAGLSARARAARRPSRRRARCVHRGAARSLSVAVGTPERDRSRCTRSRRGPERGRRAGIARCHAGQTYPYGIAGLPGAGTPGAGAIAAEVDRLRDALDAVSDLLLAESVHQAVQGNVTRTRAALQALTAPEVPPEPDVIRTPRSGRVLTFRIALALDATRTAGWIERALTASAGESAAEPLARAASSATCAHRWTVRNGDAGPACNRSPTPGSSPSTWC